MRPVLVFVLILGLLATGCIQTPPGGQGNNTTNITPPANNTTVTPPANNTTITPPGYEVADYCKKDSDCIRKNSCCDCGLGQYVNNYSQAPECPPNEPRCMCAIALSHGECNASRCIAIAGEGNESEPDEGNGTGNLPAGFCGSSTEGKCVNDSGCISGGCSGQVCQSAAEPPIITTCEYRTCYDASAFGVSCGCSSGKCRWQ